LISFVILPWSSRSKRNGKAPELTPFSPVVIFEAGAGGHSGWWEPILKEVSKTTKACAYDQAGMGWSDYVEGTLSK